jgi:hypothetical protein
MKALLPVPVFDAIAGDLRRCGNRAHRDWEANQAHEDSLTGAAFADFRTRRTRRVHVDGQEWLWRVTTRKFGSGGPQSEERLTGADGIIEIEVRHTATGRIESKGPLVQAKKNWARKNTRLFGQVGDMGRLAPGSSAALDYSQTGYTGIDGRSVLVAEGDRRHLDDTQDVPLGDLLADRFLSCKVGLRGLYYEPRRRVLHLPSSASRPEAISILIAERMRLEIEETRGA